MSKKDEPLRDTAFYEGLRISNNRIYLHFRGEYEDRPITYDAEISDSEIDFLITRLQNARELIKINKEEEAELAKAKADISDKYNARRAELDAKQAREESEERHTQ